MSIVALDKVTLVGLASDKDRVLDELQALGCCELIPLAPGTEGGAEEGPGQSSRDALRFLLSCPRRGRQVQDSASLDPVVLEEQALSLERRLRGLEQERDDLVRHIQALSPWGEFEFPSPAELAGQRLWFYIVPVREMGEVTASGLPWTIVRRDPRECLVVAVSKDEPEKIPGRRAHTGSRSLKDLKRRREEVEILIDDAQEERVRLSRWGSLLALNLNRLEDRAARRQAARHTLDSDPVFALQGWAPRERREELRRYAAGRGLMLTADSPAPEDRPPTLLRNPPSFTAGEDLVNFYMTPGYRAWDPSPIVFMSFAIFFAMILADAGYAALLALGLFCFWKKLGASPGGRKYRPLAGWIVTACLAYGVLIGSYFGVEPPAGSLPARLRVIDMHNASLMMAVSVIVGVAHVMLANLMDARRRGRRADALAPLGWACVMAGGLGLALGAKLDIGWLPRLSTVIAVGGGLLVVFFSEPHARFPARLFKGLGGLTKLTSAFGDILSYLRLFALGLASASLAVAFNSMAAGIRKAAPLLGLVLAALILLLGHALNLTLGISSGVIHGLRLNVIEFFNWGLKEEGRLFKVFQKKEDMLWNR